MSDVQLLIIVATAMFADFLGWIILYNVVINNRNGGVK